MQEKAPESSNQRRSTRLMVAVPVTISGKNTHGESFREETRTIDISWQGASIITSQTIAPGSEIVVENPPLGVSVKAYVTVFFEKASYGGRNQIGVELLEAKTVWGIQYPPADWRNTEPAVLTRPGEGQPPTKLAEADSTAGFELPGAPLDPEPSAGLPESSSVTAGPLPANVVKLQTEPEAEPPPQVLDVDLGRLRGLNAVTAPRLAKWNSTSLGKGPDDSPAEKTSNLVTPAGNSSAILERLLSRVGEAQKETQLFLRSTLEGFPQQLQQAAQGFREAILSDLAQECVARAAMDVGAELSRSEEQAKRRISLLTQSVLEDFEAQLRQAAQNFIQSTLPEAAQECAARFAGELRTRQDDAVREAENHFHKAQTSTLEDFEAQLQQAAQNFVQSTLPGAAQECSARFAGELQTRQADAVREAENQIHKAEQLTLQSFQGQLQHSVRLFGDSIERFLQASSCQISKSAEDILAKAHEELAKLYGNAGEEVGK